MDKLNVTFDDRYGGKVISWLRACLCGCEATGYVPHKPAWAVRGPKGWRPDPDKLRAVYGPIAKGEPATKAEMHYDSEWLRLETINKAHDGYHFVPCYFCGGSGRCTWIRTIGRIPRWIVKGVRFWWQNADRAEVFGPNTTRRERWVFVFKVAFLADLGLWRP